MPGRLGTLSHALFFRGREAMGREVALLVAAAVAGVAPVAPGQATGMPSFNAPHRAVLRSEVGAGLSFPHGGGTRIQGAYCYASGKLDGGLRGGILDPPRLR